MPAHDAAPTAGAPDLPEMPAPRVREFPARSTGGGFALPLGLLGLLLAAAPLTGATTVDATGVQVAPTLPGALTGLAAFLVVLCGDRAPQPVLNTGTLQ
ncbi:hypothetical protein [Streptomyces sp. NPDC003697]